jgi:hypothetical protein
MQVDFLALTAPLDGDRELRYGGENHDMTGHPPGIPRPSAG